MAHTDQRCENCRFFRGAETDDYGACLRYPPQIEVSAEGYRTDWIFPKVNKFSRCGEWRPILESGNISAYDEEFTQD